MQLRNYYVTTSQDLIYRMNLYNKDVLRVIQEEPLKLCLGGLDSKHYFTPGSELKSCLERRLESTLDWWAPCEEQSSSPALQSPSHKVSFLNYMVIYSAGSLLVWKSRPVTWFPSRKIAISSTAFTPKGEMNPSVNLTSELPFDCSAPLIFGVERQPAFLTSLCLQNRIKEILEYKPGRVLSSESFFF